MIEKVGSGVATDRMAEQGLGLEWRMEAATWHMCAVYHLAGGAGRLECLRRSRSSKELVLVFLD